MKRFSHHLIVFIFACFFQQVRSQTLIINEVSNGPSGNQEYVELVVASNSAVVNCTSASPPCIDIRGWIFDDNSGYHGSNGVASGAVRFSQNLLWSCVPIGTIIVIYNNSDRNPAIPADDLSLSDGNCSIIAPLSSTLFESNNTTPGAIACSYPPSGWTSGGSWSNTLFANPGDCARIVNLAGCEVFSVCWGSDNLNNLIYMSGSGAQRVYYFNGSDPVVQANWSFGSTTPSPGAQTPGAANNTANAAYISQFNNGCVPITPVNVTATAVNAGCTCNGSATATATGSIPGYTYTWYTSAFVPIGQTTATATGLCAGMYNVVATSSTGCSDTANITITSAAAAASVTVNSQTVCAGSSTTLAANPSVTGGTYSWAPGGQTTQTISLTPASDATYTVTYTLSGCSASATGSVTVTPLPVVNVNSDTICNGSTASLTANGASTYAWSAGTTITGISTADVSPSSTAIYTVTGTTAGCSSTAVSTVTVNPAPVTIVDSATICAGAIAILTAGGAATYTWSAGATSSGIATATATATPATTTTYTVTGTAAGCSSTAVALVTISLPFSVNAGADDSVCFGGNTSLTVLPNGPGYSYLWSSAATLTGSGIIFDPTASPAATTIYSVIVTDPDGCTGSDSVTVYVDAQIDLTDISSLSASCNGACDGQANIIPTGGSGTYIDFLWSSGCTTAACIQCAGTDTVTVTDSWGCSATNSITVNEPSVLTATITSQTNSSCSGACDGTVTVTGAGGTASYSYSWNTVPIQNTATAAGLCAGIYTCTLNDVHGCSTTATVTISQPGAVVIIPLADAVICNSGNTTLTAMAGGGNSGIYSYAWSPSTGLSSDTISNPTAAPASTTAYILNVTDGNGCSAVPDTVIVTVNSALSIITGGNAVVCSGNTALISAVAISGSGSYNYSWAPVSGLSNPLSNAPTASPTSTTTYTVTVTDGCSAPVIDSVTITILPVPVLNISSTVNSGCAPVCVNFNALSSVTGTDTIHQWSWAYSDGGTASVQNPSYCFNDPGSYDVSLTTISTNGCSQTITSTNMITVFQLPVAEFTSNTQEADLLHPEIQFTDQSLNAATFNWNFGDSQFSSQLNPVHTYNQPGMYTTTLIVTSQHGCVDSVTHEIVINELFTFYAPNAFSPNDDYANQLFLPMGRGWKTGAYELNIFDRWGNLCFLTTDPDKGWDGKVKKGSEIAQQDVYVWKVMLTDIFSETHIFTGSVTIVK